MEAIKMEDLLRFRFPENAQWNPDGTCLAWQAAECDEENNTYKRDICVWKDRRTVKMTAGGGSSLLCWDDESTLLLTKQSDGDKDGKKDALPGTQLYKMSILGGEAQPWVKVPLPVLSLRRIGEDYLLRCPIDANDPDAYLDDEETARKKAEEKKKDADYDVVDEVPYWMNGAGFTNKKRSALFLMKVDGAAPQLTRITGANFDTGAVRDVAGKIYFSGRERGRCMSLNSNLFCYDLKTGETTPLYDRGDLSIGDVLPLGGSLYIAASDRAAYGVNETLTLYELTAPNELRACFKPEYSLYNSVAGDCMLGGGKESVIDGDTWYTLATVEDHAEIFAFDAELNRRTVLSLPGDIPFFDIKNGRLAICCTDREHLPEIRVQEGDGFTNVSHLNDSVLAGKYIAQPQLIHYTSCGLGLHGWVLLPEGFSGGQTYPAILDVHGGPRCVYGDAYFHEMQVWASHGYVVMFTNIKGSDGRGDAFADIRGDYGGSDFQNLMDFVDAVLAAYPNIDASKLCETGGSYGGFMTNWIITHTDRFCAAASQRSISNWISMSLISDIGPFFGPDQCGSAVDSAAENLTASEAAAKSLFAPEAVAALWEHSPLKYAANVTTPTLFLHSDQDYRCPLPEGMQMMQALAVQGVETRLIIFRGENHELSRSGKPLHRLRRLKEITDWFDRHTK